MKKTKLPSALTTVTPFSKIVSAVLFLFLPFAGFILGMEYQARISNIENPPLTQTVFVRLKNTFEPTLKENWIRYTGLKGYFSVQYPKAWRLESAIDQYPDIGSAEKEFGNHFSIYSYRPSTPADKNIGLPPKSELKVEARVIGSILLNLSQWINKEIPQANIIRKENILINEKPAAMVWSRGAMEKQVLTIFYKDDTQDKGAMFYCYPSDSDLTDLCREIAQTFRFE